MEKDDNNLTNNPKELLKAKQELNKQKEQYASFVHNLSGDVPADQGLVSEQQHREPDDQNHMKDVENRIME